MNYPYNKGTYKTRIGTVVFTNQTESYSGQRDIGGSVVTKSGRIVLAVGPSDCFQEHPFVITVSDDGGKTFDKKFETPLVYDVSYHTAGMLYDSQNDILMAVYGETQGFQLTKNRNDHSRGIADYPPKKWPHSKLMMARSVDDGQTWKEFTLYDYKENNDEYIICGGIGGCGVEQGGQVFVPAMLISSNAARNAMRWEVPLLRIKNLNRENTSDSFEFENNFRRLATNADKETKYADETVYIEKVDGSGYISFNRSQPSVPCRREYDRDHNPIADFTRVFTRGFDKRDYPAGDQGPMIIAFNVVRMLDGNLMMASRFYGTDHHRAGNIFLTSRDEGVTWDYEDDHIPYSLEPFMLFPNGAGGNPSMSYMPDGSLVHTTSAGGGRGEKKILNEGNLICCFKGLDIDIQKKGDTGKIVVDASNVVGLEPVYICNAEALGYSVELGDCNLSDDPVNCPQYPAEFSPDRQKCAIRYKITHNSPSIKLKIVLANKTNSYRPVLEPTISL